MKRRRSEELPTNTHSRRDFLGMAGIAAAAAGAASMLPPSIARALSIPASSPTGTIDDIEHVVILMQENRSFDHYFGTMRGVRGFGDRFTIPLPDGRSVWEQNDGAALVLPYHLDQTVGNAQRVDGTPHSWRDAQDAWDGGRMSDWAMHKNPNSMGHYTAAEIPFQFALADAFTICDAYHCSIQAGTNANRLFLWTGTNGPTGSGVAAVVNEFDSLGEPGVGYEWTTYPERLEAAGVSWKVYQFMPDNFGDNSLQGFLPYRDANKVMGNDADGAPYTPYDDSFDELDPLIKGIANTMPDGGFLEAFAADVRSGRLPQVSWIVAPSDYSEHPGPSSPVQGGWYTEAVIDALTATPGVFARTVLFVNYDENDGFFDHVPPPAAPSLSLDGTSTGDSTCDISAEYFTHPNPPGTESQPAPDGGVYGMGPRVPLFVVSPWSRGGWVDSEVFDHTSIIRFLESRFDVREPNISPWRRAVAGDLTSALDFGHADNSALAPIPTTSRHAAARERHRQEALPQVPLPLPTEHTQPAQSSGTRLSRALPYELAIRPALDLATADVVLAFDNSGDAGAVFHVYDKLHLDRRPRRYTVEAGGSLSGAWSTLGDGGRYDLWVLGPNGFHRSVAGRVELEPGDDGPVAVSDPAVLIEVSASAQRRQRMLRIRIENNGREPAVVSLTPNAYQLDDNREVHLQPGAVATVEFDLRRDGGWYDLTATVAELPGFERRLAGRVENGDRTISDPH